MHTTASPTVKISRFCQTRDSVNQWRVSRHLTVRGERVFGLFRLSSIMVEYVTRAKQQLESVCPSFLLRLAPIRLPPIHFDLTKQKAREELEQSRQALILDSPVKAAIMVKKRMRLTFVFLFLQLHARGNQTFWAEILATPERERELYCFLAFSTVELYCDLLTHIQPRPPHIHALLEEITEVDLLQSFHQLYEPMITEVRQQRAEREPNFMPNETQCARVAAAAAPTCGAPTWLPYLAGATLVAGVAWLVWRRRHLA
ncbi:uncharacterized protein MONBRDRAFT_10244 [Monosiga brevicollis MX1]|uniref:Uncharacterized protein n=1 Tax=Monosiga brevicollis TaxID=81824 RepID=A9V5M8_MONBE|nr:uncharacterized protein MONBRDRAFT_10244 [Monosiga brevicollis MX1]EDQ87068.1 predicted protein [Monosiga brevicollis MX1]|eukprot:XP_001748011.1 hypothetical protein [Monosiga brevicollis MX1]